VFPRLVISRAGYCSCSGGQRFKQRTERRFMKIETGTITLRRESQHGFAFAGFNRLAPDDRNPGWRKGIPEGSRYSEFGYV
jgi:hypothetical protein